MTGVRAVVVEPEQVPTTRWTDMLALPEITELRRRRRLVTTVLGLATVALFAAFLVGFAYFPETLGTTVVGGIPLSLWIVLGEFVGTWVLVFAYFRLSRNYLEPAARAAVSAVNRARGDGVASVHGDGVASVHGDGVASPESVGPEDQEDPA